MNARTERVAERIRLAKDQFTKAAIAVLQNDPQAVDLVQCALDELNSARAEQSRLNECGEAA